jgi:hypothetical protein
MSHTHTSGSRRLRAVALMAVASLAVGALTAGPAAADTSGVSASDASAALADVPGLFVDTVRESRSDVDDTVVAGMVEIPEVAGDGVDLGSLTIDLPGSTGADEAVKVNAGTVVYPSDGDFATAVQATADGGVRALVVIDSADAPTEYRFPIDGATALVANPDGTIAVLDGAFPVATIALPWAVDADGASVPTAYRIEGTTIVQTVDHAGAAYPVVADPKFQADCGNISCTVRLDRATTRTVRDASQVVLLGASICGYIATAVGGPLAAAAAAACALAIAPAAVVISIAAARYYENGNCLQLKVFPNPVTGAVTVPGEVKKGTRNCR